MKILLVSQYFWPESFVINDLVKTLVSQGHAVTVLTGKPNYPDGRVFTGYQACGAVREEYIPGVWVFRAPLRPRGTGSARGLLLNYLSFVWNGLVHFPRAIRGEEFDIILVFCLSPITAAIPAIYLKWRLRKHLAIWVQDLWPESLKATGFVRNSLLLWGVGVVVRGIYSCADTLLAQSKAFYKPVARYARADKIIYYPNSYLDPTGANDIGLLDSALSETLSRDFCLVFAGNLGIAQSVQTIVAAAEQLRHLTNCKLVLVGSGSMLTWLQQQKAEKCLDNLILVNRLPPSQMPLIFSKAAGLLVTLKRDEIFTYTVPSKVQAYLAAGKPILASLDGEGARVIDEARAGIVCAAEDSVGLANGVQQLYDMSEQDRDGLGRSAREYYLSHFEMKAQSRKLVEILQRRIDQGV